METEKNKQTVYMANLLIILVILSGLSVFFYREKAFYMLCACVLTCTVLDYVGTYIIAKRNSLTDMSAIITGIATALLMPPSAPIWLGVSASAFSVIAGRLLFAKKASYSFAPAAAGITAAGLIFPEIYYNFPEGETISEMILAEKSINMTPPGILNVLSGNIPGFIGTTSAIFIFAALIYLAVRRPAILCTSISFLAVVAAFAIFYPRVYAGGVTSLIMELTSGSLLFCAVFLLPYPSLELKAVSGLFFGIFTGAIYMILTRITALEDCAPAAVLISGVFFAIINKIPVKRRRKAVAVDEKEEESIDPSTDAD